VTAKQNLMPEAAVLCGALVWGMIWYPYRVLLHAGVSGALATLLSYTLAMLFGAFMLPRVYKELRRQTDGWMLALILSAGWANAGYVLAVLHGEVMRVLLLFYLAPLWTILFSYALLGERLNRNGYFISALSLTGAATMLWTPSLGAPLPNNPAEWIGLSAGMAFALSNVVSRRAAHLSIEAKSYGVWLGTVLLAACCWQGEWASQLRSIDAGAWVLLILLGIVLCAVSFVVQYAVAHLPANRAIILFLFELVVAAVSSYLFAQEAMHLRDLVGALLIISASLLSARLYANELPPAGISNKI
jgi:drug/metabolite transporter (DMT)-like permease